jgi:hypothetical protein
LREEPNNEKAIFRKGVSRKKMEIALIIDFKTALMKAQKWEKAIEQFTLCKNSLLINLK